MVLDLEILQAFIDKGDAYFNKKAYIDAYNTYDQAVQYIKTCKNEGVEPYTVDECEHMATLKTAMGDCLYREYKDKLNPQDQQLFTETEEALKRAMSRYQEALDWSNQKPTVNSKKLQDKLGMNFYECDHLLAILYYNYGLELYDNPAPTQLYDDLYSGVKYLQMSLNRYHAFAHGKNLLKTTLKRKHEKDYNKVIEKIKEILDEVNKRVDTENLQASAGVSPDNLNKMRAIIDFLLIEKTVLMRIAEIENSSNSTRDIDEKIGDFYSIVAQEKNIDDLIAAIKYYKLAAQASVDLLNERNIKIYLSVMRCYVEMIKAVTTQEEKENFAKEMIETISATGMDNPDYIPDIDCLELSYYRFQMYLEIKHHEEAQKFAKELISWYEQLSNNESSVLIFQQDYHAAIAYLKMRADVKAAAGTVRLNTDAPTLTSTKRTHAREGDIPRASTASSEAGSAVKILRATGAVLDGARPCVVKIRRTVQKETELIIPDQMYFDSNVTSQHSSNKDDTDVRAQQRAEVVIPDNMYFDRKVTSPHGRNKDATHVRAQQRAQETQHHATYRSVADKKRNLMQRP